MTTPKKKHLIELMIEAGVKWPEGAEYAAQDKSTCKVHFYKDGKPTRSTIDIDAWSDKRPRCFWLGREYGAELPSLCRNWHQTIVTREQYEEAVADAESWAAWMDTSHLDDDANKHMSVDEVSDAINAVWHNTPSIEQLTSDYHTKAAEADRLQSVADDALKAADDALLALEKAGELIGLVISIGTKQNQPVQPEITDWRDLRVGDVIWVGDAPGYSNAPAGEYSIVALDSESEHQPVAVDWDGRSTWPKITVRGWRFIRRP